MTAGHRGPQDTEDHRTQRTTGHRGITTGCIGITTGPTQVALRTLTMGLLLYVPVVDRLMEIGGLPVPWYI